MGFARDAGESSQVCAVKDERRILQPMQAAEIELKFPVADVRRLRAAAEALGFELETERTFEHNTLYDTPERLLRGRKQILRLRQYGDTWTVTHKRKADAERC